jgi:rfaE bifunctional protein nucleotidyltransferase chain/domain
MNELRLSVGGMLMGRIVPLKTIVRIAEELKKQGKKVVTTNGAFDIFHVGHVRALKQARSFGDILIVGVNSDSSIRQYKGDKRPIIPENERAELVASLECVDYVVIFSERDPSVFVRIVKPGVHVKSGDYSLDCKPGEPGYLLEKKAVEDNGGKIMIVPLVNGFSTTSIIKKISEAYGQEHH